MISLRFSTDFPYDLTACDVIPYDLKKGPPQAKKNRIWACDLMISLRFSTDFPHDLTVCGAQNPKISIKS